MHFPWASSPGRDLGPKGTGSTKIKALLLHFIIFIILRKSQEISTKLSLTNHIKVAP